jgi:3-deoxy-D-manno-octulosonate 8-phosphate phosphatase KdsC-like HAD superfamily phosphatase
MSEPVTLEFIARQLERVLTEQAAMRLEMEDLRGAMRELHDMVIVMRDDIHAIRVALLQLGRRVQALEDRAP